MSIQPHPSIEALEVRAYTIPTESPEADGTLTWDATTIVLVEAHAGDRSGLGYTYAEPAAARLIRDKLVELVEGRDALAVSGAWEVMTRAVRNTGRPGLASMAIAAVDSALWDLKARLLDLPLVSLLGAVRPSVPVYGSGGFTSYSIETLQEQLSSWADQGIRRVKMKVGSHPEEDAARVRSARQAIGENELMVDANGAYDLKEAERCAEAFAEHGVRWFEEPVSSDNLKGLRLLRQRTPTGMEVAAGEYGYTPHYFRRMLETGAVDVLMPDATRAGGITGFLRAAALAEAFHVPISAHTAPALHVHVCCAAPNVRHLEYFLDHARIEQLLFDNPAAPEGGELTPDLSRPGLGLTFKHADAERFAVSF